MSNKIQSKSFKQLSSKRLMLLAGLTTAVIFVLYLFYIGGVYVNGQLKGNSADNIRNTARIDRLEFCVDHSISPCNNQTLREWNKIHTESWEQYSHLDIEATAQ